MYFSGNYCDMCSRKNFTVTFDERPINLRCLDCAKVFHTCHDCLHAKCPVCNGELAHKSKTFPDILYAAVNAGNISVTKEITFKHPIEYSTFVNEKNKTLLMLAACAQKYEMCKFLIDAELADVCFKNDHGLTALSIAISHRSSKFSMKIIDLLRASVNISDNKRVTPLMKAVTGAGLFGSNRGNLNIVKRLLAHGADIFATDSNNFTALDHAVLSNNQSKSKSNQPVVDFLTAEMKLRCLEKR